MEQFISDIESFCWRKGISPQLMLKDAIGASWSQWERWKSGASSPTMATADRMMSYMAERDAASEQQGAAQRNGAAQ